MKKFYSAVSKCFLLRNGFVFVFLLVMTKPASAQNRPRPTPQPTPEPVARRVENTLEKFFEDLDKKLPAQRSVDSPRGARTRSASPEPTPFATPAANPSIRYSPIPPKKLKQNNPSEAVTPLSQTEKTPPASHVSETKETSVFLPEEGSLELQPLTLPVLVVKNHSPHSSLEHQTSQIPLHTEPPELSPAFSSPPTPQPTEEPANPPHPPQPVPIDSIPEPSATAETSHTPETTDDMPQNPESNDHSKSSPQYLPDSETTALNQQTTSEISKDPMPKSSPAPQLTPPVVSTISADELIEYPTLPEKVKKLVDEALIVTSMNLPYVFGAASPESGGLDCSGFVQYVLKRVGINDVPRQSDQQYVWLRSKTQIFPVMSDRLSSFEFDDLRPGDLLFWSGTYTPSQEREFQVTHTMIYLGRRKKDGKPLMAGASSGRAYDGVPRHGSSVFDFVIPRRINSREARNSSQFVGYGPVPGLWKPGEREAVSRLR